MLTNTYSEGFVGAVLDAQGVLDGRAPYSEPTTLKRASTLLDESIRFFANPLITPLPEAAPSISYVLVATTPSVLGTPLVFFTNYDALAQRPDLELVSEGPGWRLYKVVNAAGLSAAQRCWAQLGLVRRSPVPSLCPWNPGTSS